MIYKLNLGGETKVNVDMSSEKVAGNVSALKLPIEGYKKLKKVYIPYKFFKRITDIILSFILLIGLFPAFAIISLAIKLESKGPILFKHTRIGKDGKIIKIYKFRSMVENAEDLIQKFTPEQMKEYEENYKLSDDPRITKVGKFLRKTSLDELPQLINILKGDLSIVGPRPVVANELKKYGTNIKKFLSVTPGLTGYWAANGRSCTSYEQRMQMELFYIDNLSFKLDVKVFFKSIGAVLNRKGAV